MAGYRISPQDVNATLGRVRDQAQDLAGVLDDAWSHTPSGSGGSQVVASALAGFVESQEEIVREISGRLESAPSGVARAVAAYLEGDEEMAQDLDRRSAQVDSSLIQGPPVPAPGGYGPPVPPQPVEKPAFDAGRFGGALTPQPAPSSDLAFDPARFGGMPEDDGGTTDGAQGRE